MGDGGLVGWWPGGLVGGWVGGWVGGRWAGGWVFVGVGDGGRGKDTTYTRQATHPAEKVWEGPQRSQRRDRPHRGDVRSPCGL